MRFKQIIVSAALVALATNGANAQQPLGGCWHPDDIINWSPETDPDAKFNRSRVPLAQRVYEPELMKANENQYYEGQICNATILYPTCSLSPSQGANNFVGYQPTYWQYMDKLVYWAGSASEGIIIPPPAGSTDAAHQQGVKSLGQIFFPPSAFGGTIAWVNQMLTKENGEYIYARKLYEIAKYMGFDGWFINEEIGYNDEPWAPWIKAYMDIAVADGHPEQEIQWYNAARTPSKRILSTHVNTSQFLEYGAEGDYRGWASKLGCTEAETFSKIYAGVQVVSDGHTGFGQIMRAAMPTSGHVGSLDLFCPEERIWKDNVKNILSTSDNCGSVAYEAITKTFDNEEDMWVNRNGDPSNTTGTSSWPGISGAVLERTVISSLPFVSTMSVGVGKHRFVEGEIKGTQDWYHSGMQSILPTWRWWIENKGNLKVTIDWDNAYNSASSFKIAGNLSAGDHLARLYKTQIAMPTGAKMRVVYKATADVTLEGKFSTASSVNPDVTVQPTKTTKNGWTVAEYDLSSLNGKTVYMIALNIKAGSAVNNFSLNLAELDVFPGNYAPTTVAVSNFATTSTLGDQKGDLRLTWDWDYTPDFDHFNIYTTTSAGRKLVGQTRDEAFYIPTFERNGNDLSLSVELVPVMKDLKEGQATVLKADYPKPTAPVVSLVLSKSYIKVGETAEITAKGTGSPTGFEWVLPAGLKVAAGSSLTSNPIKVEAVSAGKQTITVKATNAIGTSSTAFQAIDVMANDAELNEVVNVALHKTVVDYSGSTNGNEVPEKIIDGVTNPRSTSDKWCNVSPDNWVIFDLENAYRIYGFRIYDANSGPESGCDQIASYEIELSNDGTNWTEVLAEEGVDKQNIKTAYIVPTNARYVKLVPHVSGTLRIWEFEVYGKDDNNLSMSLDNKALNLTAGETKNIVVTYNLNGDERNGDFYCEVTPSSSIVTIGDIKEDKAKSQFTVPVIASNAVGSCNLEVRLVNGGAYKLENVTVTVDNGNLPNILAGLGATVRQYSTDSDGDRPQFTTVQVSGLTDGDYTEEALSAIEDPSTHSYDIWAVFESPKAEGWNLAKVSVFIPSNNKGVNDNDREGIVNKDIKICYGNTLDNLKEAQTFENLGETSRIDCIFPTEKECKYIVVKCNLNPYFYASLAEIEAFEQVELPDGPLSVSGWTDDVIAEVYDSPRSAAGSLDRTGHVLYPTECGEGGIADETRVVITNNGTKFRLAQYNSNNAVTMKDGNSHELTLNDPQEVSALQFLLISAEGESTVEIVANYADGSKSEVAEYDIADWYSTSEGNGEAVYGLGRYNKDDYEYDSNLNFRLFEVAMAVSPKQPVKSFTIRRTSTDGYPTLLAVSKKGIGSSGIEDIFTDGNAERRIIGIYNIQGVRVENPKTGLYIIRYSDGSAKKVVIR